MKKSRIILSLILSLFLLTSCGSSEYFRYKRDVESFNTSSLLYIYDDFAKSSAENNFESVWDKIEKTLNEIENAVSVDIEGSDIYRFNNAKCGEKVPVSSLTAKVFIKAKSIYEKSDGKYDPTVFPLVDLWGFSPRFSNDYKAEKPYDRKQNDDGSIPRPDEKYIEAFKKLIGFDDIVLIEENGEYFLVKNIEAVVVDGVYFEAMIDFGGIAKGYAADVALDILKEAGYTQGYFSCGTSSIAFLENGGKSAEDNCFDLSIRKPRTSNGSGSSYAEIKVKNLCVSSSGDYEKYYEIDGVRYCHIIDPQTGYPINSQKSDEAYIMCVTLVGENASELDGLSTAVMTMSLKEAKSFLKKNCIDGVIAYCQNGEYKVYTTLDRNMIEIKDTDYVLE